MTAIAKTLLTPRDLADAIGASESSVRRWVDEGRIGVSRTEGGHRRIPLAEAVQFLRRTGTPLVRPEILGFPEVASTRAHHHDLDSAAHALFSALHDGDCPAARGLIVSLYLSGTSLPQLFDGPIRQALHQLGELWLHSEQGILIEHRAVDICMQALNQIRLMLNPPATNAPIALGGAPSGDPYTIPSLMATLLLSEMGYRNINFGPDLPVKLLADAAEQEQARLIWVSVSALAPSVHLYSELRSLALRVARQRTHVVVGGRSLPPAIPAAPPNLHVAITMAELAAFAQGLRAAT